jgi:hypothetical protein
MSSTDIKTAILDAIKRGDFIARTYALKRANQRAVAREDVIEAAKTVFKSEVQSPNKIRFEGFDTENEILTVVAHWKNGVVILTLF